MNKTIYEMELHDELRDSSWYITRVAGGWIYMHIEAGMSPVFVPWHNEFQRLTN